MLWQSQLLFPIIYIMSHYCRQWESDVDVKNSRRHSSLKHVVCEDPATCRSLSWERLLREEWGKGCEMHELPQQDRLRPVHLFEHTADGGQEIKWWKHDLECVYV